MLNATICTNTGASLPVGNNRGAHRHRLPNLHHRLNKQASHSSSSSRDAQPKSSSLLHRIFYCCLALLVAAASIFLIVGYVGAELARAGHSIETQLRTIIIGKDVINIPANMIRYAGQRKAIETTQLDVYLHWPGMEGYSEALKSKFNTIDEDQNIIFVTLAPRYSALDMSARIAPIYKKFYTGAAVNTSYGLTGHKLDPRSGYIDEVLFVSNSVSQPFAARCVSTGVISAKPYCIRDIHLGAGMSLTYRFHEQLIPRWRELDRSIRNKFNLMIK